ncbi:unnamed protein product, partial [Mesorhabditis spiculigera]
IWESIFKTKIAGTKLSALSTTRRDPSHNVLSCLFQSPRKFPPLHSFAALQLGNPDVRHVIHSLTFGDDISEIALTGSYDPLAKKDVSVGVDGLNTHEYILKIVPSVYQDISGAVTNSYQYTYGHRDNRNPLRSAMSNIDRKFLHVLTSQLGKLT